jgi:hypothetical protein
MCAQRPLEAFGFTPNNRGVEVFEQRRRTPLLYTNQAFVINKRV